MSNNEETTIGEVMEFLKENVATKDDLKAFATKDDLKAFATKDDLKAFATKTELTQELRKMQEEILDGVDRKLINLKGDLIVLMRGEDQKIVGLIGLLKTKAIISEIEARQLLTMEPFPQLMV